MNFDSVPRPTLVFLALIALLSARFASSTASPACSFGIAHVWISSFMSSDHVARPAWPLPGRFGN